MTITMTKDEKEMLQAIIKSFKSQKKKIIRRIGLPDYVDETNILIATSLSNCTLKIEKRSEFSHINWNHYSEYYIFYTSNEEDKDFLNEKKDLIFDICRRVRIPSDDYDLVSIDIELNMFDGEELEKAPEVQFTEIEKSLVAEIKKAQVCIYAAVAWFTNCNIANELEAKTKEGLDVIVIVDDNEKNKNFFSNHDYTFSVVFAKIASLFNNLMHDKFCIFDLERTAHGTYNWTSAANYNRETFTIDPNRSNAKKFALEFVDIRFKYAIK